MLLSLLLIKTDVAKYSVYMS